jgi:hypothetical protein
MTDKTDDEPVLCATCPRFTADPPKASSWAVQDGDKIYPLCDACKNSLVAVAKEWGCSVGSVAAALFSLPVEEIRSYYAQSMDFAMQEATQPIDVGRYSTN